MIVEDVYNLIDNGKQIDDKSIEELGKKIAETIRNRLSQSDPTRKTLGMSSIGKPLRKLWYDIKGNTGLEKPSPSMRLKFLFGDIIEDLLLWLVQESGHSVTDRQKEVVYKDIVGHIDSIIDGEVVDIKTASPKSYLKFANGTLANDDAFGYLAQITAYDNVVGKGNPSFLVFNKVTGEICEYKPDPIFDMPNVDTIIDNAKEALQSDTPPEALCYESVPDGTSGNMRLAKGCEYCPYKDLCYPEIRKFKYSNGVRYLTKVVKEPRVEEIFDDKEIESSEDVVETAD